MTEETLKISALISFTLLLFALLLTFIRLVKGPSIYDRIAAMDLVASIATGFILIYSVFIQNAIYIDIAIVIAIISFVGTIAISIYLKQKK